MFVYCFQCDIVKEFSTVLELELYRANQFCKTHTKIEVVRFSGNFIIVPLKLTYKGTVNYMSFDGSVKQRIDMKTWKEKFFVVPGFSAKGETFSVKALFMRSLRTIRHYKFVIGKLKDHYLTPILTNARKEYTDAHKLIVPNLEHAVLEENNTFCIVPIRSKFYFELKTLFSLQHSYYRTLELLSSDIVDFVSYQNAIAAYFICGMKSDLKVAMVAYWYYCMSGNRQFTESELYELIKTHSPYQQLANYSYNHMFELHENKLDELEIEFLNHQIDEEIPFNQFMNSYIPKRKKISDE